MRWAMQNAFMSYEQWILDAPLWPMYVWMCVCGCAYVFIMYMSSRLCSGVCVCLCVKPKNMPPSHTQLHWHTPAPVQANMFCSDANCRRQGTERRGENADRRGSGLTSGQNESKQQGHGRTETKSDMFLHAPVRILQNNNNKNRSNSNEGGIRMQEGWEVLEPFGRWKMEPKSHDVTNKLISIREILI